MPLFEERIAAIPGLRERYRTLTREEVLAAIAVGRNMFPAGHEPTGQLVSSMDDSLVDDDGIRTWLRQLNVQGQAKVIWIPDRNGIEIDYADFASYFDDFWYPSSDDIWVIFDDGSFILDLDHEEVFSLYRR